jgi:hypothetical protein
MIISASVNSETDDVRGSASFLQDLQLAVESCPAIPINVNAFQVLVARVLIVIAPAIRVGLKHIGVQRPEKVEVFAVSIR